MSTLLILLPVRSLHQVNDFAQVTLSHTYKDLTHVYCAVKAQYGLETTEKISTLRVLWP